MIIDKIDLPKGWQIGKLEDLLDYIQPTEYIVESTEYSNTYKIPVLTAGKSFIKGYTNETKGVFRNLPVLIFDDFTTANKFVNFPFKVKSSAMKILKAKKVSSNIKFAFYYMQTLRVRTDTHKRYWISVFSKLKIPLPSLQIQQAIVAKIEELLSDIDSGIVSLKKTLQLIKVYRQSVLKHAFEGRLTHVNLENGELPKGWKIVNLIDVCEKIIGGGTPSTKIEKYWNGDIDWITSADINELKEIRVRNKINKKALKDSAANLLPAGNIVVATRVSLGRLATNNEDITFSQDCQGLILKKRDVTLEYALNYLSVAVQIFKFSSRGTTIHGVTKKTIE